VLDVLAESRMPMTVPEIHARLSPRRANIASVYRTVHLLTGLSLVRSTDTTRRSRRYELTEPFTGHHHHLICQACGRIEDLEGCVLTDEVLARLTRSVRVSRQFQVLEHELRLFGRCRDCAA
jgi:Fur family ferric uptake transcriptional regulator